MNAFFRRNQRQQPSVFFLPPVVIEQYLNQWVTTTIPGYGRVIAYVADFNRNTGMVSLLVYQPPFYNQQFVQVHNSDLVSISPYFGPTPPRPGQGGGGQGPWNPGGGQGGGGGFWPWIWNQVGGGPR